MAEMRGARTRFVAAPTSAAQAKNFVRGALSGWPGDLVEVVLLLTSELVTNAVVHTGSDVELIVAFCSDGVRVEVHDADGEHFPVLRARDHFDERGRGILLVDRLSVRWGAAGNDSGKWVWFETGAHIDQRAAAAAPVFSPR